MKKTILLAVLFCTGFKQSGAQLVSATKTNFEVTAATIYVDDNDFALVKKSAALLQQDIEAVCGKKIIITSSLAAVKGNIIIIGSQEKSSAVQQLALQNKLNTAALKNKWEAYQIQITGNTLVIAGSDRRGTAYGVFELSKQLGVSPWYWWADVPVIKHSNIYINNNINITDAPKVKYRGIFINDEAPALSSWSKATFGGFNHLFYQKVFELMLRLKANYLWPAMWGNAFYDDDSLNIKAADEYGIVIGTSHHEPLMRAHDEWRRYGNKKLWNYDSTATELKAFWRTGMQRATNEKIVSVGMRGDGDAPMSRETATSLLEKIVNDQRRIIEDVTHQPASETPQLWALYKEVQDYYDKGMRVPDDITLLLCDDNWGNIRKLPKLNDAPRKGGYGIYYHFDYVGGPRNYKWLNTNPIPRVWEQMHLAYEYNVKNIWIVNVGDIKPMEFPISFFLDYAWNPEKTGADDLQKYTEQWSADQFGKAQAKDIAVVISTYSKYNGRRKPELLDANTFELHNEFPEVTDDYNTLLAKAEKINTALPAIYRDAFFQLVLHPVKACANLYNLYNAVAWNRQLEKEHRTEANAFADKAKQLYANDSLITLQYHQLKNGKWNYMMSQTHIGYTYWQQPPYNKMPQVMYVKDDVAKPPTVITAMDTRIAEYPAHQKRNIFYEFSGSVSMEAAHYTSVTDAGNTQVKILPGLGRTGDAVTVFPVTAATSQIVYAAPELEYEIYVYDTGSVKLQAYFSPTLNFHNGEGLKYAVAIDTELPQVIFINKEDNNAGLWNNWVANNIIIKNSDHHISSNGKHLLKCWLVSPGAVLQKLVLHFGSVQQTYLGPPETINKPVKK